MSSSAPTRTLAQVVLWKRNWTCFKIYRMLQILTTEFNNLFQAPLIPIAIAFSLSLQTIGPFVCIKFHQKLHSIFILAFASSALLSYAYAVITFSLFSNVNIQSKAFLARGGDSAAEMTKEWKATKRALSPVGVVVGRCYVVQKQTVLQLISITVSIVTNLLVST